MERDPATGSTLTATRTIVDEALRTEPEINEDQAETPDETPAEIQAETPAEADRPPTGLSQPFFLGTYTSRGGPGIGRGHLDLETGRPTVDSWSDVVPDPSWLELTPDGQTLYVISELTPGGLVHALNVAAPGPPVLVNTVVTGAKPAHLARHPHEPFVFASLYDGGSVAVHPIGEGIVSPASDVQQQTAPGRESHVHQVVIDPTGEHVLAVNLGLDSVTSYRLDPQAGSLVEVEHRQLPDGTGPRHLVFHPEGEYVYLADEVGSTVTVCHWSKGRLEPGSVVSTVLPPDLRSDPPNYPGEIIISADGRFVYLTNRGAKTNTVAVFSVENGGAELKLLATPSCGGDWPRHLALDCTGRWLYIANERSGDVCWFPVDPESGLLGPAAGRLEVTGVAQIILD